MTYRELNSRTIQIVGAISFGPVSITIVVNLLMGQKSHFQQLPYNIQDHDFWTKEEI